MVTASGSAECPQCTEPCPAPKRSASGGELQRADVRSFVRLWKVLYLLVLVVF